jgi:hypothetical protein
MARACTQVIRLRNRRSSYSPVSCHRCGLVAEERPTAAEHNRTNDESILVNQVVIGRGLHSLVNVTRFCSIAEADGPRGRTGSEVGLLVSASFGDPAIKQRDPLCGPCPVARHRPCFEASLDRADMGPHISY